MIWEIKGDLCPCTVCNVSFARCRGFSILASGEIMGCAITGVGTGGGPYSFSVIMDS
jgi:hypothetical protein